MDILETLEAVERLPITPLILLAYEQAIEEELARQDKDSEARKLSHKFLERSYFL